MRFLKYGILSLGLVLGLSATASDKKDHAECKKHEGHEHKHGAKDCHHKKVKHGDHQDYEHDGHHHAIHGDHVDDHDKT